MEKASLETTGEGKKEEQVGKKINDCIELFIAHSVYNSPSKQTC